MSLLNSNISNKNHLVPVNKYRPSSFPLNGENDSCENHLAAESNHKSSELYQSSISFNVQGREEMRVQVFW